MALFRSPIDRTRRPPLAVGQQLLGRWGPLQLAIGRDGVELSTFYPHLGYSVTTLPLAEWDLMVEQARRAVDAAPLPPDVRHARKRLRHSLDRELTPSLIVQYPGLSTRMWAFRMNKTQGETGRHLRRLARRGQIRQLVKIGFRGEGVWYAV